MGRTASRSTTGEWLGGATKERRCVEGTCGVRGSRLDCGGGVRRFFPGISGQPSGSAWMPYGSNREAGASQAEAEP
jgi:hypothetical protein